MKKQRIPKLLAMTMVFTCLTFGVFLGKSHPYQSVFLSVPVSARSIPSETEGSPSEPAVFFPIDINRAGLEEFLALPGIGEVLARRILDYRDTYGGFTACEDLLNVKGIGTKRYECIREFITLGG